MDIYGKRVAGYILMTAGILLFLVEFKAIPHKPENPKKWDELHKKYFTQIRISARTCLLLGLTFSLV